MCVDIDWVDHIYISLCLIPAQNARCHGLWSCVCLFHIAAEVEVWQNEV